MQFAICNVPVAPLRNEPSHKTEMVSQLLFGEVVSIIDENAEWIRIKALYDDYEGWITRHLLVGIEEESATERAKFVSTGIINAISWKKQVMYVPMAASLTGLNIDNMLLWNKEYVYTGKFRDASRPDAALLEDVAYMWLNAPYLWGGRTFMGVDCSGFVQNVFKILGVRLKRDACQQAEEGILIREAEKAVKGDLVFFKNDNNRVVHVGIMMDHKKIIHASGQVRIDILQREGIFHLSTGEKTHLFHSIRRVF